jgi:hypothetical protein
MNAALATARGDFVTHLDDDDFHHPTRIEELLGFMRRVRCDVAFHPFLAETADGKWVTNHAIGFQYAAVSTSSVMYHRFFTQIPWDIHAHLLNDPGDWNRFRRFLFAGAVAARYPEVLLRHYRERNNTDTRWTPAR